MSKSLLVIVGAGPGVSAGIARKFGNNGFKVILIARKKESLDLQIAELQQKNIEAHGVIADAAGPDSLKAAFKQIKSVYGIPDILIYNAGANTINNPSILEREDLFNDFKVNVAGALISAQQIIPEMMERGKGTILFTGGMLAINPVASRASASISKAGLRNLSFALAEELFPYGIHVGTVTIGGVVKKGTFFDPDLIAESYWNLYINKEEKETVYKQV